MMRGRWSMAGIVLLALQRALTVLVTLMILLSLIALLSPSAQGPSAVAGGNGDPGAGFDSPGPYMTVDLFWEVPAQNLNMSEASPAVLEAETVDKEAPQEGQQAVPDEENSEAFEPTGMEKRFSSAEDTKTDPNTVEGMANPGAVDAKFAWSVFVRAFLVAVVCSLIALLLLKVAPAWAKDIKERITALRASSELLDSETRDKKFMVDI
ncbi:hypothetical protein EK904_014002 [Melospiza melodia maxima]|nr:hypothetical protein EK904_014002 [Melospiza melodia maxima]